MRILLIEDDMLIGDGIKTGLSKMGFSVDWFTQGRQGKEALYSAPYDAVILDLTLPGMDGRDILREWREKGQREPVLILTARDALAERVEGLRLGADDYLCKPFALIEVAARLEALMRRTNGQASNELRHGNVMLDPGKRIATLAGEPLTLNFSESPNRAAECSLWQVLEMYAHPKYSLSTKAVKGIMYRAWKRNKTIPAQLQEAMDHIISQS